MINKDDISTCENLDENDKVAQWIKTMQTSNLNEQCDESYPSNEEILHYVCGGHNLRSNEVMEFKKLPKVEEALHTGNIEQAIHSIINHNETKSLDKESLIDDINQRQSHHDVCDEDSNLQAVEHDVNISLQEGEYIENKSPTHSVKDEIPMQSHNFRQNNVTHSDETFLTTTAIEGEYIDYNNAIQQN